MKQFSSVVGTQLIVIAIASSCNSVTSRSDARTQLRAATSSVRAYGGPNVIEGSELHIVTANGMELSVDESGFLFRTAAGNTLRVQGEEFRWTTQWGYISHGGNELTIASIIDDPAKLRLASPGGNVSAISFNQLQAAERQEELALIAGGITEDDAASLGGQLKFWAKRKYAENDQAMRLVGAISSAYTSDPDPTVRWRNATDLGPFSERPYEGASTPSSGPTSGPTRGPSSGPGLVCELGSDSLDAYRALGCSWAKSCSNCCGEDNRFDQFQVTCP